MNCPRCNSVLSVEKFKDVEIDRCSNCQGMWLDFQELDQLEDRVLSDDPIKGTMVFRSYEGDLHCPHCESGMQMFHYRAYDLELDFCPGEHGFWLDKGEEKRVLELMEQRVKDLKRTSSAEAAWADMLKQFTSKSFADRMKGLFRR